MRILHCADLQIGAGRKLPDYLERDRHMMLDIVDIGVKYEVDAAVCCGDVYEREDLSHAERLILLDGIASWRERTDTPWFMIAGNHEIIRANADTTTLGFLTPLTDSGLLDGVYSVDGTPRVYRDLVPANIVMVPWRRHNSESFRLVIEALLERCDPDQPTVVLAHETFNGSHGASGRAMTGIDLPDLPDVTYWALGDIHYRQALAPNAWYTGPGIQHRFDEHHSHSGVLIVDTDDPENPIPVQLPTALPLFSLDYVPERESDWPDRGLVKIRAPEIPDEFEPPDGVFVVVAESTGTPAAELEARDNRSEGKTLDYLRAALAEQELAAEDIKGAVDIVRGFAEANPDIRL